MHPCPGHNRDRQKVTIATPLVTTQQVEIYLVWGLSHLCS